MNQRNLHYFLTLLPLHALHHQVTIEFRVAGAVAEPIIIKVNPIRDPSCASTLRWRSLIDAISRKIRRSGNKLALSLKGRG